MAQEGRGLQNLGAEIGRFGAELEKTQDLQDKRQVSDATAAWKMGLVELDEKYQNDTDYKTLRTRMKADIDDLRMRTEKGLSQRGSQVFSRVADLDTARASKESSEYVFNLWKSERRGHLKTNLTDLKNKALRSASPAAALKALEASSALIDSAVESNIYTAEEGGVAKLGIKLETAKGYIKQLPWAAQLEITSKPQEGLLTAIPPDEWVAMRRTAQTKVEQENVTKEAQAAVDAASSRLTDPFDAQQRKSFLDSLRGTSSSLATLTPKVREKAMALGRQYLSDAGTNRTLLISQKTPEMANHITNDLDLSDPDDQKIARYGARALDDTQLATSVLTEVNNRIQEATRERAAKVKEYSDEAADFIKKGGRVNDLPAHIISALDGNKLTALRAFETKKAKDAIGHADASEPQVDNKIFQMTVAAERDDAARRTFIEYDLTQDLTKLSKSDYDKYRNQQKAMASEEAAPPTYTLALSIAKTDFLDPAGIKYGQAAGDDDSKKASVVFRAARQVVDDAKKEGRTATREEIEKAIAARFIEFDPADGVIDKFGYELRDIPRDMELDRPDAKDQIDHISKASGVPVDILPAIVSELKKRNRTVTLNNISTFYKAWIDLQEGVAVQSGYRGAYR
jgi:hypothetical protein